MHSHIVYMMQYYIVATQTNSFLIKIYYKSTNLLRCICNFACSVRLNVANVTHYLFYLKSM